MVHNKTPNTHSEDLDLAAIRTVETIGTTGTTGTTDITSKIKKP
ncbi:hypothetical protein [Proteus sp. STS61-E]